MNDVKQKIILISVLYAASFSVNKYVLSVLKFQYPTIFQGWQTLFGFILLTALYRVGNVDIDSKQINLKNIVPWLPYICSFITAIYSGSVALAQLDVPVFMSLHNNVTILHLILDRLVITSKNFSPKEYCIVTTVMISSLFITQTDDHADMKPYLWMLLHSISSACIVLYPKLNSTLPAVSKTCRLYTCYLLSVVTLLPSTFLLGDAMAAKNFAFWYYYRFYIGCVLSGIFGVYLNLSMIDLTDKMEAYNYVLEVDITGISKLCVSLLSLVLFPIPMFSTKLIWCLINLCAGTLITGLDDVGAACETKSNNGDPEFKSQRFIQV